MIGADQRLVNRRDKDEAYMTEAEKKRWLQYRTQAAPETRSMDMLQVSKLLSQPQAKRS
jgi:hypothetical protein